jgi:hypothetical protein
LSKTLKKYKFLIFVLIILSILKTDFRFKDELNCCSDDFDYFTHSETIVEDFDFDYSNQLEGIEDKRFYKNNKSAPIGFVGTGIYSAPFMFIGKIFDKFFSFVGFKSANSSVSYKLLFYSFSSIFYLFFTLKYMKDSLSKLNLNYKILDLTILILGVGISYYAFERYSMSHVYESFSLTMLIYFSIKFYHDKNKSSAIFIPIFAVLGFSVKWVHYYLFLIPLIIKFIFFSKNDFRLRDFKEFWISLICSSSVFLLVNKLIYGVYTINPAFVYISDTESNVKIEDLDGFWGNAVQILLEFINRFMIILFTQEFGLLWFSPIIFIGTALSLIYLIQSLTKNRYKIFGALLLSLSFAQVIFITILWKSPGSGYGFRYTYNLFPIAIIIYYYFKSKYKFQKLHVSLLFLSLFSFTSTLFFESTELTQLSLEPELNSFGIMSRYTERYYLEGYLESFLEINSYLKLFITSFLGAIILKIFLLFVSPDSVFNFLDSLGLPANNENFIKLVNDLKYIDIYYFFVVILLVIILYLYFDKKILH